MVGIMEDQQEKMEHEIKAGFTPGFITSLTKKFVGCQNMIPCWVPIILQPQVLRVR